MYRPKHRMATLALAAAALAILLGGAARAATGVPRAPEFRLTLLDGKTLSLDDLKGKPVLVNFWWSG